MVAWFGKIAGRPIAGSTQSRAVTAASLQLLLKLQRGFQQWPFQECEALAGIGGRNGQRWSAPQLLNIGAGSTGPSRGSLPAPATGPREPGLARHRRRVQGVQAVGMASPPTQILDYPLPALPECEETHIQVLVLPLTAVSLGPTICPSGLQLPPL